MPQRKSGYMTAHSRPAACMWLKQSIFAHSSDFPNHFESLDVILRSITTGRTDGLAILRAGTWLRATVNIISLHEHILPRQ